MTHEELRQLDRRYVMQTYGRFDVDLDHGSGATLYDLAGREYIDFSSGIGVNSVGYAHPKWVKAVADQAGKLDHLLLPGLGLGFVTANPWHPLSFPGQHTVQASRFRRAGTRPPRRSNRLAGALIRRTCETQARAKAVHDALEAPYVRATDFAAVDAVRRRCEQALFG